MADIDLPAGAADFRLMDRQAVDALNNLPERVRFVRGLVQWVGFRCEYLPYASEPRMSGETKYSLLKMMAFALSGLTSFSVRPLRLSFFMALAVIAMAGLYSAFVLYAYWAGLPLTPGWASILLMMMLLGGQERSEADFRALLGKAGFEIVKVTPTGDRGLNVSVIEAKPA